jgi:single-stranded DNA-binding protein
MSKRISSYSKTILIGRLGHDPVKRDENSAAFPILNCVFEDGVEKVQSHKVLVFGKQKDVCMTHLKKGDLCCIEGKLEPESYDSKLSPENFAILAERITFLSHRHGGQNA